MAVLKRFCMAIDKQEHSWVPTIIIILYIAYKYNYAETPNWVMTHWNFTFNQTEKKG